MNKDESRCWKTEDRLMIDYHDHEWGTPLHDDKKIFEFLILEGFQAGLSWITILRKRENFRKAFDGFDYKKIASYERKKIDSLLQDSGIIRNRLKIKGAIANARAFIGVREKYGTFDKYFWNFTDGKPIQNKFKSFQDLPARTELSDIISKDLKDKGFKFVGSTIVYAHLQATGMVNDHLISCFRYKQLQSKKVNIK